MMKKIIFLLILGASPFVLLSMDIQTMEKVKVVTFNAAQTPYLDEEYYKQYFAKAQNSLPPAGDERLKRNALDEIIKENKLSQANPKPIFFATGTNALFALNYLAKNPNIFSALILDKAQLDDYNYILNLHRNVPNIPIIFFNEQANSLGSVSSGLDTKILYAKMKQRSETESKTYLIPPKTDLGVGPWINNILIHEGLLEGTPTSNTMNFVQPIVQGGIETALKDIEKNEKFKIFGIRAGVVIGVFFLIYSLYKTGATEKIMGLFKK